MIKTLSLLQFILKSIQKAKIEEGEIKCGTKRFLGKMAMDPTILETWSEDIATIFLV